MAPRVIRRRWYARPLPILLLLASLALVGWYCFGTSGLWDMRRLALQRARQAEQIRELEAQKKQLADYLIALKAGDEAALERAAREKGFVGPTETIYNLKVEAGTH
jgi:cell division protein FtsB